MSKQKIIYIKVSDLHLWTENPRDPVEVESTDFEIINRAITDNENKWNLPKLIEKMGDYYDTSELPTVVIKDKKYIIYDGNRRIAVLKYLQNKELYSQLNGGLYFNEEPKRLREMTSIPCNVCDIETALKNVERKHENSGDWNRLERDYFSFKHLNKEKSHFIILNQQTGIISDNPKMNQRFVKDEMLSIENLAEIGFNYDTKCVFVSNYSDDISKKIIDNIVSLVVNNIVSTRKNRRELLKPLLEQSPELENIITKYDPKKMSTRLTYGTHEETKPKKSTNVRKTPKSKKNDTLFGKTLSLKEGKVNDLYRAILNIYEKNQDDATVLPIIGMSMRLILEVGARVYYNQKDPENSKKDRLYKDFLKAAKNEMLVPNQMLFPQEEIKNYLSLTGQWLDDSINIEGLLAKYAHGNILVCKDSILKISIIIGEILEYYFKK